MFKMLSSSVSKKFKVIHFAITRNYGISPAGFQKASDPIQQLFVEKIREYALKKKSSGGKLVESTSEIEKQMQQELEKVARQYGGGPGVDMTKFPTFKFQEPNIDPQV